MTSAAHDAPTLTAAQRTILMSLQLHNGTTTFVADHEYREAVPELKRSGMVIGGGTFYHRESRTMRETLGITVKGIAILEA